VISHALVDRRCNLDDADIECICSSNTYPQSDTATEGEAQYLDEEGQQLDETAAPPRGSPDLESVEQRHPKWFKETNPYKPCPWDTCPSPPPQ
jgi:hypothetical protein